MKKGAGEAAAKVAGAVTSTVSAAKKTATKVAGKVQSAVSSVKKSVSDGWNKLKSAFSSKSSPKSGDVKNAGAVSSDAVKGDKKTVDVNRKTVTMDNSTFDPNFVDKQGRTNVQRMEQGLAPIGTDGKSVNIHHMDQTNDGPVMEIIATKHQQNYSNLHTNIGQSPSQINRREFDKWRSGYWEWRSNNLD